MKTITCLAAAAAVLAGVTVAQAQTMGTSPDKSHPGAERGHKGTSSGSVDNPTPRGNGGGTTGQAAPRGSSRATGSAPAQPAPDGSGTRVPQSDE